MTDPSERIVRRKLADEIIDRLKAMIASGEMRPGDALPSERELIERFGVGRLPIREALQTLSNMGSSSSPTASAPACVRSRPNPS